MISVAFLPALVAGALFSGFVKRVLYATPAVIAVSFIAGGIVDAGRRADAAAAARC